MTNKLSLECNDKDKRQEPIKTQLEWHLKLEKEIKCEEDYPERT